MSRAYTVDPWADVPLPPDPDGHTDTRGMPQTSPARTLTAVSLLDVRPVLVEQLTTHTALPVWPGMLTAIVGEGESGKTWIGAHTARDVAQAGHAVLVLDGEMSAPAWLRRLRALDTSDAALARIHYSEMSESSASVELVRATVTHLHARLVIWDSALSLISRTARSENDNAEVSRVYDRLRDIVRNGPAGLIVDHTTRGSGSLVSRGATAKFNALDVSYGVKLADGSVPGPTADWSSVISVEKDRHGLLGGRGDREATFAPLGGGNLAIDIGITTSSTHRLAAGNPLTMATARIRELDPPPKSANDAHSRIGGNRQAVLAAYRQWNSENS